MVSQIATLTPEEIEETPMVDLVYMILSERKEPMTFQALLQEVAKLKNFSAEQTAAMTNQLYTEINIDGRFVSLGDGLWGIKKWYPIEQFEDVLPTPPSRKRKAADDELDDIDDYGFDEDLDEVYEEEFEDFDEDEYDDDYDDEEDEDLDVFEDEEEDLDVDYGEDVDLDFPEEEPEEFED